MSDPAKWLRELSEPWSDGEKVKTAIDRAAKLTGLSYWRAFDIWYDKARQIADFEVEQIAAAIEAKNERDARNELRDLKARIARMESVLAQGICTSIARRLLTLGKWSVNFAIWLAPWLDEGDAPD